VTALKSAFQSLKGKADDASNKFYQISETLLHYAMTPKGMADLGSAFTPGVSEARAFYEMTSGKNVIDGSTLGLGSRALLGVGVMLGVGEAPEEVALTIERVLSKEALAESEQSIEAAKSVAEAEMAMPGTRAVLEEANKESPNLTDKIVSQEPEILGKYGEALAQPPDNVKGFSKVLEDYLGPGTTGKPNAKGDWWFVSADGERKVRFDIADPVHDGMNPHMHIEIWDKGKNDWVDAVDSLHQIYPGKLNR